MNFIVGEFHQETNSFNPLTCTMDYFEMGRILEGQEILTNLSNKPCAMAGMLNALDESKANVIPGFSMFTMSGGPVDQKVVDQFIKKMLVVIHENHPVDGVFLSFHGATQTTEYEDCSGYIMESLRSSIGEKAVMAVSTDLHANITSKMMKHADIICGYQTYPHIDHYETGYRTAKLGLSCLLDAVPLKMVQVKIPMIVPASTYTTMSGPFSELIHYAKDLKGTGEIVDFSIYQMQPWLDVEEACSSIIVIDHDCKKAEKYALELGQKLFNMRKEFQPNVYSIDEVIDFATENRTEKPVILVDSADSSNAGATGDSVAVVKRLIERKLKLKTAFAVVDAKAALLAHQVGVGKKAVFHIGGSKYPEINQTIVEEAYVKSLHDGLFMQEGPAGRGMMNNIGKSAVLQVGNIDILVCHHIFGNGDPQLYRAFGMEPTFYQLVVVKACTSFRAAYSQFADEIYETDTPGAANIHLKALPFKRIPKDFYPFSELDGYQVRDIIHARNR